MGKTFGYGHIDERKMAGKSRFPFEDLDVWHKAIEFAGKVISTTETINTDRKHYRLVEQLESASASVALNIAEGKGRYSKKEFIQFLYIARGLLFETITLLRIMESKGWIENSHVEETESRAECINKMLPSLIKSIRDSIPSSSAVLKSP
jgi:four helix bundle protein